MTTSKLSGYCRMSSQLDKAISLVRLFFTTDSFEEEVVPVCRLKIKDACEHMEAG